MHGIVNDRHISLFFFIQFYKILTIPELITINLFETEISPRVREANWNYRGKINSTAKSSLKGKTFVM